MWPGQRNDEGGGASEYKYHFTGIYGDYIGIVIGCSERRLRQAVADVASRCRNVLSKANLGRLDLGQCGLLLNC